MERQSDPGFHIFVQVRPTGSALVTTGQVTTVLQESTMVGRCMPNLSLTSNPCHGGGLKSRNTHLIDIRRSQNATILVMRTLDIRSPRHLLESYPSLDAFKLTALSVLFSSHVTLTNQPIAAKWP